MEALKSLSNIELGFSFVILLCGLFYLHFFLGYSWNQKQLELLDEEENFNLIGFTFWGGLVCIFTLVPLFLQPNSKEFAATIVLLLICVVTSRYFYFRSLRKFLNVKRFDNIYKYMVSIYLLLTFYFLYVALTDGMNSIYDLSNPKLSASDLRNRIIPYDLKKSVKILFVPNYLFCMGAYVYLIFKSFKKKEYLITFGVSFTMGSILFTNSYHLLNLKYWMPINVIADVFELFRLNIIQKQMIKDKLNFNQNKLDVLEQEVQNLETKNFESRILKHDLANKFTSSKLYLDQASRQLKKDSIDESKLKKAITNALEAQSMASDLLLGKNEVKKIDLRNLLTKISDLYNIQIDFESKTNELIHFNSKDLNNILVNLIKNAKEANLKVENPWVKVYLDRNDKYYLLKVVDSGIYSDTTYKESLFKHGFSTKGQTDRGLGLYSVKTIVSKHEGDIQLVDFMGNTCFEIQLGIPSR